LPPLGWRSTISTTSKAKLLSVVVVVLAVLFLGEGREVGRAARAASALGVAIAAVIAGLTFFLFQGKQQEGMRGRSEILESDEGPTARAAA